MPSGEVWVRLAPALQVKWGETRRSGEHKREEAPPQRLLQDASANRRRACHDDNGSRTPGIMLK